ncbi:MAG: MBL fold metallo-hydrolase [Tannerellaceae bacterium]
MKITFLGTGTSTGNPEIGCCCEVCTSTDCKDHRLRASVLLETALGTRILIDCGPDFRFQMLRSQTFDLNAVLLTHHHYDHVGGLDDLRPFCRDKIMPVYAEEYVTENLYKRIPYVFAEHKYPGIPRLDLLPQVLQPFKVDDVCVTPIRLMHHKLPIFGYRIGNFAYLTDLKTIPESEYEKLEGLDVLVINALRMQEHISHQSIHQALSQIERIAPKRAYLTHMSHHFGLHAEMAKQMPANVYIAYDTLQLEI